VRQWTSEAGWNVVRPGDVEAPLFALNLNTLLTHAGTDTFPDFSGSILLIEDMDAPLGRTERSLVHLSRLGVFDKIKALLWGRVETPDASIAASGANETKAYRALLREFVPSHIPLVTEVDVSHTTPILTLAQGARVRLCAPAGGVASLTLLEPMVSD